MEYIDRLARSIVREGWFAPSVKWEPSYRGGAYVARWEPLWGGPGVRSLLDEQPAAVERERLAALVDRLVREGLTPEIRESAWRSLRPRYGVPNTPLEKWVYSLLYEEEEPREVADWFADDVNDWLRDTERHESVTPFRLAFVLLEPQSDGGGAWTLVPGLQALDDPRRFIPAGDVWAAPEADPIFSGRIFLSAAERLDEAIAQAAAKLPILSRIRLETPWVVMSEQEAVDFLEFDAAMLEAAGYDVVLPSWWEEPAPLETAITYRPPAEHERDAEEAWRVEETSAASRYTIGFHTLLSYRKDLLLHGAPIPEEDWRRLTERDAPFFHYNGRWVRLTAREKTAADRFFRGERSGVVTAGEALQTVFAMDADQNRIGLDEEPLPLRHWSGAAWLERTVAHLRGADRQSLLPLPALFQGELRDYQQRGYSWLVRMRELGFGACLADDMGLGKTVQWIAYALCVRETQQTELSEEKLPFLLLCPTSVLGNWQRELERFAPSLSVYLHYGPDRAKEGKFRAAAESHDLVLTSYSTALRDISSMTELAWETITLDEAQYMKNSNTKLARMIYQLRGRHRIAMTGTPLENHVSDLWSIFAFLNPGYLGSERGFRRAFGGGAEPESRGGSADRLHRLIRPFLMRRMKTDQQVITDLPEKSERTAYCGLTERQGALYAAALSRMEEQLKRADGMKRRGVILATITRLKQICNAPEHALREPKLAPGCSGKLIRLEELLRESLAEDGRTIVFTQYALMAKLLQTYVEERFDLEVGMIAGLTPRKDREEIVRRFQEEADGPRILVLTLKTGGFGLNLTRANQLIHYDRWWNPAAERQATDRAYRIGQTREVSVWKLVTKGTLEEAIERQLLNKERLAANVVGSGETWITEYSDAELKELLSLRAAEADDEERRDHRGGYV